jgi:uroporphyrinogen-III decarboxylase
MTCAWSVAGRQSSAPIGKGFSNPGEYVQEMESAQRIGYVMGFVNGLGVSPLIGAPGSTTTLVQKCLAGKTPRQLDAILSKYINDHPEAWHMGLNVMSLDAMLLACDAKR